MRIVAIGEFEAGSDRAHAINVVKTAGGFARLGHDVAVYCHAPGAGKDAGEIGGIYGEPSLEWRFDGPAGAGAYARWASEMARAWSADVVYARSFRAGLACARAGLATVIETHAHVGDSNPLLLEAFEATRWAENPVRGIVTISRHLAEHYAGRGARNVHVVPDGVDLDLFSPPARGTAPAREGPPTAVYAGHLYDYKGVPTMLEAAGLAPEVTFEFVGGTVEDQERVRGNIADAGLGNVIVHGAVEHVQVPRRLWRAGVLLLPPSARDPSSLWTSPVKLGEYLASGRPIVASRIPGLETWVDEPAVRWFTPDDAHDLARAIGAALEETAGEAARRTARARELAMRYSYPARASAILGAAAVSPVGAM